MNRWTGVLGVLLLGLAGCVNPQMRGQSAEETEREKDLEVRTIGEVTEVANVQPVQISGVGLVTGLDGTGHSPPGIWRNMLEQQLRKLKVENIKSMLDSPNNCLVLVSAYIPAGARKGDVLDVEITLPDNSKATSLRGGYLHNTTLRDYDSTKHLMPNYGGSDRLLTGHIFGFARGPVMVGFGGAEEPDDRRVKKGRIWGGGISVIERPFNLLLKNDDKSFRVANAVAEKLNNNFQDDARALRLIQQNQKLFLLEDITQQLNQKQDTGPGHGEMAKAVNKEIINLRVPYAYRFNAKHYLLVARLTPLIEAREQKARYRARLQKMLLDPSDTIRAALRLEALGKESVPALKQGLESPSALVRFASAEALAYLGSTAGVEELSHLAEHLPDLRMHCLMALASLDEGICRTKLAEMLTLDDTTLRCGAFLALRLLDESAPRLAKDLGGELLGNSYWVHQVAPKSPRLVYFAPG